MGFWRRKRQPKCENLVKYNGRTLEVSGIKFGDFQLGKVSTESKLIQNAVESLMILDAGQYHRCITICNIMDEKMRDQEFLEMSREVARINKIAQAIMALSYNHSSKLLQDALAKLLVESSAAVDKITDLSVDFQALETERKKHVAEIRVVGAKPLPEPSGRDAGATITVSTDRKEYRTGDEILLKGKVETCEPDQPVVIQVYTPSGRAYRFDQVKLEKDGSFEYRLQVGGPLAISGIYITRVTHGSASATTEFRFTVDPEKIQKWRTLVVRTGDRKRELRYIADGTSVKDAMGDPHTATLTIQISADVAGELILELPRTLFDSKESEGESDLDFIVFVDEIEAFSQDTRSNGHRILEIMFEKGSKQIDIVGTWMAD